MTMARHPTLNLLMEREQRQCDQAQAALQRADAAARQAHEQRVQLVGYRNDYEARWSAQFHRGGAMDILLCYRNFMQRLDQAVAIQTHQAEQADRHLAQARQRLLECERRVASVRKLIERRAAELAHAGRQREQKQVDEQAQRMHWRHAQLDQLLPQ